MKNAASCENFGELQTHRTIIFRTHIAALDLRPRLHLFEGHLRNVQRRSLLSEVSRTATRYVPAVKTPGMKYVNA